MRARLSDCVLACFDTFHRHLHLAAIILSHAARFARYAQTRVYLVLFSSALAVIIDA